MTPLDPIVEALVNRLDANWLEEFEERAGMEFVDPQRTGLYIEVRAASPSQGTYYVRYKEDGKTRHAKLGRTTDLTLEDARKQAIAHKLTLKGPSPLGAIVTANLQQHAQPVRTALPGEMLLDVFMTEHYFPHAKAHKRSVGRDEQLYRLKALKFLDLPETLCEYFGLKIRVPMVRFRSTVRRTSSLDCRMSGIGCPHLPAVVWMAVTVIGAAF